MLNSRPVRLLWHSFNWLTRVTIVTTAVTAACCALIIIVLRYWLLPDIEQFHDKITASLSTAMGNPVSIEKIQGNWDGLHPHLSLSNVRILDKQGEPALVLPQIETSLSWLSLLAAELRLTSLEIERPTLLIRRDVSGKLFIGSVAVSSENNDDDLADWLLHQSRIVVRNAIIVWLDEQRNAPPLLLNRVNLHIENLFSHHQFALRASPAAELATPLDIRGDFHGKHYGEWDKWRGQVFAQLDYTDILAWRPWIKLPEKLSRGRGAVRGWLNLDKGALTQLTADLVLQDITTRLTDNTPPMNIHFLRGRASWKALENGWEIATDKLSLRLLSGVQLQPTNFYFRTQAASKALAARGELRANLLQIESLISLTNFLPLEAGLRNELNTYAPRGLASDLTMSWQGTADKLISYKIKGKLSNMALQQVGTMPGFSGLSLAIDGNETSGNLNLNTRNLTLDAPGIMREPLQFHTLTGQINWQREHGELLIKAANVALNNDDLTGNLYGSFQTKKGTLGIADLTASLTHGEIGHAARYIPLVALDKKDSDWLNEALLSGKTEDFRLRLKANLSDFPLNGSTPSLFEIGARAHDVSMQFAPDWPKIENLSGEFQIHNNKLQVRAPTASMLGAHIHNLLITQPDMSSADPVLELKGEADAANTTFLQFIQQSPVRGYIEGFTDGMTASGNGHINLSAQIPLLESKPAKVAGVLRISASDINIGNGIPWLRNTNGELSFTESDIKTNTVTANILGGPARLNVQTLDGGMLRANLQGRANLDQLRKTETTPLPEALQGSSNWDASISTFKNVTQLSLNSNLQGISSSLPAPFNKSASEIWPLHFEKKGSLDKQDLISVQLSKLLSARLISSDVNGVGTIKRGNLVFGGQSASLPAKDGIWISGNLPALSVQGWGGVTGNSGIAPPIAGGALHIEQLTGYGLNLKDLQITLARRGDGLAAQLTSLPLNGELMWQPHGFNGKTKLSARLRNLHWAEQEKSNALPAQTAQPRQPQELPAIEVNIEDFLFKGKNLGRFEMIGIPEGQNWRLRRLHITNPDGTLTGDGLWRSEQTSMQTQINLLLDISNAGKILSRSGYPNTVKNGSGKMIANLSWDGQPFDFNYASLDGTLKLDTGQGQFLKMEPGIGKLLGILSLQALPKRITLDFTDVFSSGFEFDNINGNATIKHGMLQTDDLHIDGSSAKVTMKGQVNMNDETQNLRVEVLPTLGSSVSMLSAFAAGPVVGIGTLIVSKILGNPLDKLISFEYNVTGKWSDPSVVKVGEKPITIRTVPKTANPSDKQ
ncbi:MAG: YhdP family protein [Gallionella sp.]|nr:YhdP family protein [Gallionella sp.]